MGIGQERDDGCGGVARREKVRSRERGAGVGLRRQGRLDARPKRPVVEMGLGRGWPRWAGLARSSLLSSLISFPFKTAHK